MSFYVSVMDLSMEFSVLVMGLVCTLYTSIVSTSIPIYRLQRVFYPQNLACTPKNDEAPYMLLYIEVTKIRNKTKCTPTVQILCIGTDRSQQTVQTKIRLLLRKQSDQGLRCLPFHQHLLDALMQCYIKLFYF